MTIKPGYVDEKIFTNGKSTPLCERCFKLRHYNVLTDHKVHDIDIREIYNKISREEALVLVVVDLFDIPGSIIPNINNYIGKNPIIVIGNKRDILPKPIKDAKISTWLARVLLEYGYDISALYLVSAKNENGIDNMLDGVRRRMNGKNVYIIGQTNVGKSTLINKIIKRLGHKEDVTVSDFPGTTLGLVEIPFDGKNKIIDTPGIGIKKQYVDFLDKASVNLVLPKKEIKPRIYQLNCQQTLFIAGLARVDFISGSPCSFVCYFGNELIIHRTKLVNADGLFSKHIGDLLNPPSFDEFKKLGGYAKRNFKIRDSSTDVVVSGLGFISIKGDNKFVCVHAPEDIGVCVRKSLFG